MKWLVTTDTVCKPNLHLKNRADTRLPGVFYFILLCQKSPYLFIFWGTFSYRKIAMHKKKNGGREWVRVITVGAVQEAQRFRNLT